jgi:hypothetical protein
MWLPSEASLLVNLDDALTTPRGIFTAFVSLLRRDGEYGIDLTMNSLKLPSRSDRGRFSAWVSGFLVVMLVTPKDPVPIGRFDTAGRRKSLRSDRN